MPRKISSLTNPKIKNIVRLRERKHRDKTGLTVVEGSREVECALEAGVEVKELYICSKFFERHAKAPLAQRLLSLDITVNETTEKVFEKISYGDRHEGIIAVCFPPPRSLYDIVLKERPLLVVIEGVEKPGNLGAILRTCDGAGVDGVIICDCQTDLYNPNVIRTSLGTIFSLKVVVASRDEILHFLKGKKIKICATLPTAEGIYTDADLGTALAVAVGSEEKGLSDFWVQQADLRVAIPMRGQADSLNVAASTAILLYESLRQRGYIV